MAELKLHQLCLPLHREVVLIRDRTIIATENVRLKLRIRLAHHSSVSLVPSTFIDGEDQVDIVLLILKSFCQLACRPICCCPHAMLLRDLHRLKIYALHNEEARLLLDDGHLFHAFLPLVKLVLIPRQILPMDARVSILLVVFVAVVKAATTTAPLIIVIIATPSIRLLRLRRNIERDVAPTSWITSCRRRSYRIVKDNRTNSQAFLWYLLSLKLFSEHLLVVRPVRLCKSND